MSTGRIEPETLPRAARLPLIGGGLAFDFANTASGRGGPIHLDHLTEPEHLLLWAEHAGILDGPTALALRERGAADDAGLLRRALELRECIHDAASALAAGRTPGGDTLGLLSRLAAEALAAATLAPAGAGFQWSWPKEPPNGWTLLGPIVLSAVGMLRNGDISRLKQCRGEHCGWVFFDLTKNRSRRWCEMSVCGNRAKQRKFRTGRAGG